MVGDMFNTQLKAKLDALCTDIAAHLDLSESAGGGRCGGTRSATGRRRNRRTDGRPDSDRRVGRCAERLRYAIFPESHRLAIRDRGAVSIYDTGDHRISVSDQAQSGDRTLTFTSQDGLVRVADLPKVAG
jgi:hypothetical protein